MEYTDFIVEVRNSSLTRVGQLKQTDLTGLIVVPRDTAVGSWELSLPAYELNAAGVRVEHELCKALRQPGAGLVVTGPGGVILSGPAVESSVSTDATDPDGIWSFTGLSDMHILLDSLAWGDPSTYDLAAQKTSNDTQSAAAETLIYSYVSRNIGTAAVTQRKNTRLTLATDQGRGPVQQKSPRFQNLLQLVQEIVAGTTLIVDIVQVGANLEVRVTERADLSGKIRMDIANDQLSSVNYTYSAPGATHAIVAGQGEGIERTMIMRSTTDSEAASTAWGRRIERFIDQRQTDSVTELQGAGDDSLSGDGKTITAFEVTPNPNLNLVYGVDWTVGAKVTVVIQGQETVAIVTEVPISISSDGVLVGAVVGNPSGFTWEATVDAKTSDLETRLAQLEANAESAVVGVPTGSYLYVAGRVAPVGTLKCDGSAYAIASYGNLAAYLRPKIGTVTITVANPAVFTSTAHALVPGDRVYLTTSGALPTGLATYTVYYVIASGLTADAFRLSATSGGSAIVTSGTQSGTHSLYFSPYEAGAVSSVNFKVPDNGDYVISGVKSGSAEFGSVGSKYGAKTITQTEAQMPSHTHIQNPHAHSPNSGLYWLMSNRTAGTANGSGSATLSDYSNTTANTTAMNQYTGGGQAMNNIQPTVAALLVIKT